jgi:CRISPR system Cascade subunit CasC
MSLTRSPRTARHLRTITSLPTMIFHMKVVPATLIRNSLGLVSSTPTVTIDRDLLVQNLAGNAELADLCIEALVRTLPSTSPGGKRASFASHGKSQFALVEVGTQQPRSLAAAFCEPVRPAPGRGIDRASAERLLEQRAAFETVYGTTTDRHAIFQAFPGQIEGSLEQITQIVKG